MKKFNFKFIVSMDREAVQKLDYIAEYYGRDRTNYIRWLVRNEIINFERERGKITINDESTNT